MNVSSWRKAADFIAQQTQATQQIQAAATADSNQLESLPLSSLAADDSGPPQVNYSPEQPLAASTPRATTTPVGEIQPTDPYCQIILGMSECLYPTLTADSSLSTPASDDCSTLHKQITSELDKYLQEATEKREAEDNYFDGCHMSTNTYLFNKKTTTWKKKMMSTLTMPLNQLYRSLMSKTPAYIILILLIARFNHKMIWPRSQKKKKKKI